MTTKSAIDLFQEHVVTQLTTATDERSRLVAIANALGFAPRGTESEHDIARRCCEYALDLRRAVRAR